MLLLLATSFQAPAVTGSPWGDLFVSQGPLGIIAGFLLYIVIRLWGEYKSALVALDAEKTSRLADANASAARLLQMSDQVHQTTDDLAKIADRLERTKT